jgi:small subunit ribosomal protein S1
MCDSRHDLIVDLGKMRGIIPREEAIMTLPGEESREIAVITRVGKPVCFKVMEILEDENGVTAVLSRRLAQEECYENYIKKLSAGDIIDAKITHQEPFGCFCDIGRGIISLLSIDCISVSRISHPNERFFTGQYIKAAVKKTVRHDGRITLTHKELLGTWEENAEMFNIGETVAGIVRSVESYGIFVELAPNLAGLAEWREGIVPGQCAAVFIKNIIPEKMKIKLVTVDSYSCENVCRKLTYFCQDKHIDYWKYSPDCSQRVIETVFDDSE